MQNKAKVNIGKMNISAATIKDYDKKTNNQQRTLLKAKPNKAKVNIGKMNVSVAKIKDYDKSKESLSYWLVVFREKPNSDLK